MTRVTWFTGMAGDRTYCRLLRSPRPHQASRGRDGALVIQRLDEGAVGVLCSTKRTTRGLGPGIATGLVPGHQLNSDIGSPVQSTAMA